MAKLKVGQYVIFEQLPEWVSSLPDESKRIFEFCSGKPYPIAEIQRGMLVIDVSSDVDGKFGGRFNDLRIEPEFVRQVSPPKRNRRRRSMHLKGNIVIRKKNDDESA